MELIIDAEYFSQRIQCSRDDKEECLYTVRLLLELAVAARAKGILALDQMMEEHPARYSSPFLRKAVQLIVDVGNADHIRKVLYNTIFASNYFGRKFLTSVVITETVLAIQRQEDLDYIFRSLIPSYFGMEFERNAVQVYERYRALRPKPKKEQKAPEEGAEL